jgi:hypothetical protein
MTVALSRAPLDERAAVDGGLLAIRGRVPRRPPSLTQPFIIAAVNYNTREELRCCLESLGSCLHRAVVFDNHSTDGSADMVRKSFPTASLVENPENPATVRPPTLSSSRTLLAHVAPENVTRSDGGAARDWMASSDNSTLNRVVAADSFRNCAR